MQEAAEAGDRMVSIEQNGILLPAGGPCAIEKEQAVADGEGAFLTFMEQPADKGTPDFVAALPLRPRAIEPVQNEGTVSPNFAGLPLETTAEEASDPAVTIESNGKTTFFGGVEASLGTDGTQTALMQLMLVPQHLSEPVAASAGPLAMGLPRDVLTLNGNGDFKSAVTGDANPDPVAVQPRFENATPMTAEKQPPEQAVDSVAQINKVPAVSDPGLGPLDPSIGQAIDRIAFRASDDAKGATEFKPALAEISSHHRPLTDRTGHAGNLLLKAEPLSLPVDRPDATYPTAAAHHPLGVAQMSGADVLQQGGSQSAFGSSNFGNAIDFKHSAPKPVQHEDGGRVLAGTPFDSRNTLIERSFFDPRVAGQITAAIPPEGDIQTSPLQLPAHILPSSKTETALSVGPVILPPLPISEGLRAHLDLAVPALDDLPAPKVSSVPISPAEGDPPGFAQKAVDLVLSVAVTQIAAAPPKEAQSLIRFEVRLMQEQLGPAQHTTTGPAIASAPIGSPTAAYAPIPTLVAQIREHVETGKQTQMEMTLSPDELGKVRLHFVPDGDRLRIVLQAERPDILDLLRRNADLLAAELRGAGFVSTSLSFGSWNETPDNNPRPDKEEQREQPDMPKRISAPQTRTYQIPSSVGLDLRV